MQKQKTNIAFAEKECQKYNLESIERLKGDTSLWQYRVASRPGFARWRVPHFAAMHPSPISSLAIGQRDLSPYFHNLTGLSLYMQLYRPEISNPHKLLAGNLDLSFVIIFLLPLLILVLTFDLISGEKETGTFPILVIQSRSIRKLLLLKFLFYFLLVCILMWLLALAAFIYVGLITYAQLFDAFLWIFTSTVYMLFWFGIMLFIISFNKTSSFNALAALSCWIVFLIVLPSFIMTVSASNTYISNTHLSGFIRRRSFSNHSEAAMTSLIKEFIRRHPDMQKDSSMILSGDKGGKAYAAFVEQADSEAYPVFEDYKKKIMARNDQLSWYGSLSPSVTVQSIFNNIAHTDRLSFFKYQDALKSYHEDIVGHYQYKIFYNVRLTKEDYIEKGPTFKFKPTSNFADIFRKVAVLCLVTFATLTAAVLRIIRANSI
jgi:ABC-2 type transport system permease protein